MIGIHKRKISTDQSRATNVMPIIIHQQIAISSSIIAHIIGNRNRIVRKIKAMRSPQLIFHQSFPALLLGSRIFRSFISEIFEIQRGNLGGKSTAKQAEHSHGQVYLIYHPFQHNRLLENRVRYIKNLFQIRQETNFLQFAISNIYKILHNR
ncbi:hypothetical protein [Fibrobacter sp. UWT3]|uniref:hypothetical protein n=1 Tax=Fibrobacter sp. UWT3 TaxID=1896225 RepID=UPI001596F4F3|nr:hypothetical protein [Fibrobacter sp. UWT3]